MEWYLIVLICLGYYIMWIVTSIFLSRTFDDEVAPYLSIVWPVMLPLGILMWLTEKYGKPEE